MSNVFFIKVQAIAGLIFLAVLLMMVGARVSNSGYIALYIIMATVVMIICVIIVRQEFRKWNAVDSFKRIKLEDDGTERKVYLVEGASGRKDEIKTGKLVDELRLMGLSVVFIDHMRQGLSYRILHARSIEEFAIAAYPQFAKLRDKDIIIASSMGCLVVRFILEFLKIKGKPTVIFVGGPHKGCSLIFVAALFLVPCIREMRPGSSLLNLLGLPENKKYWYFLAENDGKVSKDSACPVQTDQVKSYKSGHRMLDIPEVVKDIKEIINSTA
jgi:hypothetical protein